MDNQVGRGRALGPLRSLMLAIACSSSGVRNTNAAAGTGGAFAASGGEAGNSGVSGVSAGGSAPVAGRTGSAGSAGQTAPGDCTPPANSDAPIEKLSRTGCMSATDKTKFAAHVIPYEVNSPLWSDFADKQRGMLVPGGKTVHIKDCLTEAQTCTQGPADTGKWQFPVGTVLLKN